jgi:oligopeptide transport system substrate-binding protein
MNKRTLVLILGLIIAASMVLVSCEQPEAEVVEVVKTVIVTEVVEVEFDVPAEMEEMEKPVTLHWNLGTEPPTADPSLTTDTTSVLITGNMFVALTRIEPVNNEVVPYLATGWEVGEDADGNQTWTFMLRDDIPWVNYDPTTGETTQVVDADGNPRFVNAHDVEYGVKRTIDPATGSDYSYVLYIIKNAAAVNGGEEGFTLDDVGVVALDDWTVQFTLENAAGYFPSIASMWIAYPMPEWTIDEWGEKWTEAGLIVTNGPYVMDTWIHGGEMVLVKNPLWVDADNVQIERVEMVMITEASTAFAMYENNELDTVGVPLPEMDRVKADPVLSAEFYQAPTACTYYYGFTNTKPPFDDVRVRTAFSEAIDRQSLIDNVLKGGQLVASTFAPPGIFGAPEPGTVGIFYDPADAQAQLQSYLDEMGYTVDDFNALDIVLMHNTSEGHAQIAAAIQQMWADNLGVQVRVENQEWAVYLDTINKTTPVEDMPHVWRLGWCADYADENNWVHEVFNAQAGANRLRRNCTDANCSDATASEFDELTVAAQESQDPAERAALYEQAEVILAKDEAAYAPIYHYTTVAVTKPWLERTYPSVAPPYFPDFTLDWDAKQAATE